MWLMLPTGALSIVQRRNAPKGDERTLQVRSRRKAWIESFRAYLPEMGPTLHTPVRDYEYRAYAAPEDVARAVARAVLAVDYPNFKSATLTAYHGLADPSARHQLHDAYSDIWAVLWRAGEGHDPGALCARLGHWWPKGATRCRDCGAKRPPARRNRAKGTAAAQPVLAGEGVTTHE
jgi:hypothetical protein